MNDVAAVERARVLVATLRVAVSGPVITVRAWALEPIELTAFMLIVTTELVAAPGTVIGDVALPADV